MKNRSFLLMALFAVLAVMAVSCTPVQEISDYDYPQQRPVYNSPYGSNVIVVERDPYTGRYYQVSPNGSYNPYYNNGVNNPYYNGTYGNRGYSRGYDNRGYSNRSYDRRVYSNNSNSNTNTNTQTQPSEDDKRRAKDRVFGGRN